MTDPIKDVFQVRAELYAPSRFLPKAYELFRTRALVTDVLAQQCWLAAVAVARLHALAAATETLPRVGIIGGGHMGCAVAMALLKHEYPPQNIALSTRQPEREPKCDALATPASRALFQTITRVYDNARVSRESDVLILCVPPSQLKSVAIQIKHALAVSHSRCVLVSLLCGTSVETLQKACGTRIVLRTVVDVQGLARRLQQCQDDREPSTAATEVGGCESNDALAKLRFQAETLAAEQLTSPLLRVLIELAQRLDTTLSPSQATELVNSALGEDLADPPAIASTNPPGAISLPSPLAQEDSAATTTGPSSIPSERWLAAWTASLRELQRQATQERHT